MIRFARRDSLPRSASIKRLLSRPALAAGFALLLASVGPAAAGFFGNLDQPRIEDSDAVPWRAAKAHRSRSHREAARHENKAKQEQRSHRGRSRSSSPSPDSKSRSTAKMAQSRRR